MSEAQYIRPQTITMNIGPLGFHWYASEFHRAAIALKSNDGKFSPVSYYLFCHSFCHSLELVLKAFLLTKGVTVDELRRNRLGHNLVYVLNKAKELGLCSFATITDSHAEEIERATRYYNVPQKGFEYFRVTNAVRGYRNLPNIEVLAELSGHLISELEQHCQNVI